MLVVVCATAWCAWQAWMLHHEPAPFNQRFRDATAAQNGAVAWRIVWALIALPVAVSFMLAGPFVWAGTRKGLARRPALWLRVFGCVALLASLHAWWVAASLPYGFGSGYTHASAAQRQHLFIARQAGWAWFVVAGAAMLGAGVVRAWMRQRRPRVAGEDAESARGADRSLDQ